MYTGIKFDTFPAKQISTVVKTNLYLLLFLVGYTLTTCKLSTYSKYAKGLEEYDMHWDGYKRSYYVHYPNSLNPQKPAPLLFVLHGGGGTAKGMPGFTFGRFNELADRDGFIVVYPQGIGKQWNDGRKSDQVKAWKENVDDVGFLVNLVETLSVEYAIDKDRVFTCGISNGGFMSTRLACERPDIFRGAAIVTATISEDFYPRCNPQQPAAILVMNGTDDQLVPYEGGTIKVLGKNRGVVMSTNDYVAFWRERNGCRGELVEVQLEDLQDDGTTVSVKKYQDCQKGGRVVLYTIHGGGHTWPGGLQYLGENLVGKTCRDIVACDVIWDYFKAL